MNRRLMLMAIMKLAGDEIESIEDAMKIAMETDEQLVSRLISIAYYYKNKTENND